MGKILKLSVSAEPVRVRDPFVVAAETKASGESIIANAQQAAERIRRQAIASAEKQRAEARAESEAILLEAKNQKESVFEQSRQEGRAVGRQEILEEFRPSVEKATADFEELVRTAEVALKDTLETNKTELVALALSVAEKIIKRIADEDAELVRRTVVEALNQARDRQSLIIRAHPDDLRLLEDYEQDLMARFEDVRTVRFEEDERVDAGGVWIEAESGFIDARISTQIDEIIDSVLPGAERAPNKLTS